MHQAYTEMYALLSIHFCSLMAILPLGIYGDFVNIYGPPLYGEGSRKVTDIEEEDIKAPVPTTAARTEL